MRVPCIMYWPGKVPAGVVSDELVTSLDFLPTFRQLAAAEIPEGVMIDGFDISPFMFGDPGATSPRDAFFYYQLNNLEAMRVGRWKLHYHNIRLQVSLSYPLIIMGMPLVRKLVF